MPDGHHLSYSPSRLKALGCTVPSPCADLIPILNRIRSWNACNLKISSSGCHVNCRIDPTLGLGVSLGGVRSTVRSKLGDSERLSISVLLSFSPLYLRHTHSLQSIFSILYIFGYSTFINLSLDTIFYHYAFLIRFYRHLGSCSICSCTILRQHYFANTRPNHSSKRTI